MSLEVNLCRAKILHIQTKPFEIFCSLFFVVILSHYSEYSEFGKF